MKLSKSLASLVLAASLVIGSTATAFAATPNEDVINALKNLKVPSTYLIQAENYLKTTTLTSDEAAAVKAQIANVSDIIEGTKTKDLTKLSVADKEKVIADIKAAGTAIGVTVDLTKQSNGQYAIVAKDSTTGEVVLSFTSKEVKQTGLDNTIIYVGALMILLAAGSAFVINRNSLKANA